MIISDKFAKLLAMLFFFIASNAYSTPAIEKTINCKAKIGKLIYNGPCDASVGGSLDTYWWSFSLGKTGIESTVDLGPGSVHGIGVKTPNLNRIPAKVKLRKGYYYVNAINGDYMVFKDIRWR